MSSGIVGSNKAADTDGDVTLDPVTPKDREAFKIGLKMGVRNFSLSFTNSAKDVHQVRKVIGPVASPDLIQWAPGLPKTRSGKIMRRILRKIAADESDQLGDVSTLADPAVVDELVGSRLNKK